MSTRSNPPGTANESSRTQSTSLEGFLASPSTITETLAFSSATKDPMCKVASKTEETKKSLDEWQAEWDKMKQPKK